VTTRNRTYFAGDLRRALLDAALDVIATEGPAAVSLRGLSRTLGVSHAAPTHHFADKAALFTALAAEGFTRLGAAFEDAVRALGPTAGALDRLQAGGLAYVRFAAEHPAHFATMWRTDLRHDDGPELQAAATAPLEHLRRGVARAQAEGWAPGADPETVALTLWSAVHGLAALWSGGTIRTVSGASGSEELGAAVTGLLLAALRGPSPAAARP
jgi:AcrR family transcriptional regulator